MNTAQLAIWRLAKEDLGAHIDSEPPETVQEAIERLRAVSYDALSAIDKLEQAND